MTIPISAIASPLSAPSTAPSSMARAVPMPWAAEPSASPRARGLQHPDRTADADRSQNGKHLPAQAVGLFVHQVAQRDDRHAQQEVENFGGLTIVAVVDAADFQKEYQRDERQQRRVEDRQAEAMV